MGCFDQFQLVISPKQFLLAPPRNKAQEGHPGVLISRPGGAISMCADPAALAEEMARGGAKKMNVYGVLGVAHAPNRQASFLVVVRRKVRVGVVCGSPVWRHDGAEIIGVRPKSAKGNKESREALDEELVKSFLIQVLGTPYFYFSYDMDLTQTRQRMFSKSDSGNQESLPLLQRADRRFVWNAKLLDPFVNACAGKPGGGDAVHSFLLPVIHGAVFVNRCEIGGKQFTWSLVRL